MFSFPFVAARSGLAQHGDSVLRNTEISLQLWRHSSSQSSLQPVTGRVVCVRIGRSSTGAAQSMKRIRLYRMQVMGFPFMNTDVCVSSFPKIDGIQMPVRPMASVGDIEALLTVQSPTMRSLRSAPSLIEHNAAASSSSSPITPEPRFGGPSYQPKYAASMVVKAVTQRVMLRVDQHRKVFLCHYFPSV